MSSIKERIFWGRPCVSTLAWKSINAGFPLTCMTQLLVPRVSKWTRCRAWIDRIISSHSSKKVGEPLPSEHGLKRGREYIQSQAYAASPWRLLSERLRGREACRTAFSSRQSTNLAKLFFTSQWRSEKSLIVQRLPLMLATDTRAFPHRPSRSSCTSACSRSSLVNGLISVWVIGLYEHPRYSKFT